MLRRAAPYLTAVLLLALAVLAMTWAAMRPGDGPGQRVLVAARGAMNDLAHWYRAGPADGQPDWQAASLAVYGADPENGADLMIIHGCGACHVIPGVTGADGTVGPALTSMASQAYVAGVLPNTPGGLVRWLVDPTAHSPETAMPDLGVTESEARDIAAYLYSIGGA